MKKTLCLLMTLALTAALAGCGSQSAETTTAATEAVTTEATTAAETETTEAETTEATTAAETEETEAEETTEETTEAAAEADDTAAGNTLVAYFSWSGNTQQIANMIHEEVGGDLFEITPAVPYTEDYNELLDQAQTEQRNNARPELAAQVENWDDYDVIFVGYPNWWGDTPMLIRSFLEAYDFTGKTLVPFCTHGSGGFGRSLSSVESSAAGATILDGFETSGSSASGAADEVAAWIAGLPLGE